MYQQKRTPVNWSLTMRFKRKIQFILILMTLSLWPTFLHAEQETTLSFSPIIILDTTQAKGGEKVLLMQNYIAPSSFTAGNSIHQNKINLNDLDAYSLALGATFHITDFLNIGAACGVPLTNEEPLQMDDLSIEAMVTMQF